MTGGALVTAAAAGVIRRRVQTAVIFLVVTASAAAALLGLTLATSANAQFLGAFTRQHGAHLAVTIDSAKVSAAQLAATRHLPGVTQAAGPYPETVISFAAGQSAGRPALTQGRGPAGQRPSGAGASGPAIPHGQVIPGAVTPSTGDSVVGRASRSGPLDDLILDKGRWAIRPSEIDLAQPAPFTAPIGSTVTVTSAPGKPKLTVVGYASSVARDEYAWAAPSQIAALRPRAAAAQEQMLYTFSQAATAQQVSADLAVLKRALPAGAVASWVSWLTTDSTLAQIAGLNTPFVVAFAIIALALAVLIIANVVSAAVIASYRRIGVLKSVGFTPAQITAIYLVQIGVPAVAGVIAGTILGNRWVLPSLNGGPFVAQPVPLWIDIAVPAGMFALTGLAALVPAVRAGRLPAVAAIAAGQAPRAGHGYAAHRLAAKIRLPRPVTIGLAAPFSRPARSAVTAAAVMFGLTAVVLATGLEASFAKINAGARQSHQILLVGPAANAPQFLTPGQQRAVVAALRAQPGTGRYVAAVTYLPQGGPGQGHGPVVTVPGVGSRVPVTVYQGDAAGLGWDITSGGWYHGPGQVVVNTADPATAGLSVGETIRLVFGRKPVTARITGEVYAPGIPVIGAMFASWQTLGGKAAGLAINQYEVALRPGIDQKKYSAALSSALGPGFNVNAIGIGVGGGVASFALVDTPLIRLLTVLVAILGALGVLNSVLMLTRERVHDLGVFKAVGMTPRQTITMVTCWVAAPALAAAVIALPAGMIAQDAVVHAIARQQATLTPPGSLVHVYTSAGLALLVLAGLAIAAIGALGPAIWAVTGKTTSALRAE